jgi:hypothetical protein
LSVWQAVGQGRWGRWMGVVAVGVARQAIDIMV